MASLQELTAKAAEGYLETTLTSQDLPTKIYRGELAPRTLQEQLPGMGSRFVLLVVTKTSNPSF